ncbi:TPA: hypothetical protein DD617_02895 [Candidatus Uhrbacteria bacterium]|nr:hypothetical protein [Candidatus Uhrbacteria bacterium]
MTMLVTHLQDLGLPKNSAVVFEIMLKKEEWTAREIIDKIGLHRHLVYEGLNDLERRGIVKRIVRNDVFHFRLVGAESLLSKAEEQYAAALEVSRMVRDRKPSEESLVTFFEGVEGVHAFTEFVLKQKKPLDVLGANARFRQFYPEIFDLWNEKRIHSGIPFRALIPVDVPASLLRDVPGLHFRRYDGRLFPSVAWIFGGHVAFIFWNTRQQTEIILIRHPMLAEQQRDFFNVLWKLAGTKK